MDQEVMRAFAKAIYGDLEWLLQDYSIMFPDHHKHHEYIRSGKVNDCWIRIYGSSIVGAEISFWDDAIHLSYRPVMPEIIPGSFGPTSDRRTKIFLYCDPELAVTISEFIKKYHRKD